MIKPIEYRLVKPRLQQLRGYEPAFALTPPDALRLDSNESPYAMMPAVAEAVSKAANNIYPDPLALELREAISKHIGVPTFRIVETNGSMAAIDMLCRIVLDRGRTVLTPGPCYSFYQHAVELSGGELRHLNRQWDFSFDIRGFRQWLDSYDRQRHRRCRMIIISSPDNPSGQMCSNEDLVKVIEECRHRKILVVVDEVYIDFHFPQTRGVVGWCEYYNNLVVLRSFSKAAGLAGLRVGYAVLPDWLAMVWRRVKIPGDVSTVAQAAAIATLNNWQAIEARITATQIARGRLYKVLEMCPLTDPVPESQANFILCRVVGYEAAWLKAELERRGIYVRHFPDDPRTKNFIRITVGTVNQVDFVSEALRKISEAEEKNLQNSPSASGGV